MSFVSARIGLLLKATVSVGLVYYLLSAVEFGDVLGRLAQAEVPGVLAALLILGLQVPGAAQRWRLILGALHAVHRFGLVLHLVMVGLFFNQTLPSAIGGDVVRIWKTVRMGVPLAAAVNSVLLDRLAALVAILAIVTLSSPLLFQWFTDPLLRAALLVLAVGGPIGVLLLCVLDLIPGPPEHWRVTQAVHRVAADARRVLLKRDTMLPAFGLSVAIALLTGLTVYVLAVALGMELHLAHALVLTPLVLIMTMVPISLAGWGVREASMVTALGAVGIPAADALALSVAFGLLVLCVGLPGGLLWLRDPARTADLRLSNDPMTQ